MYRLSFFSILLLWLTIFNEAVISQRSPKELGPPREQVKTVHMEGKGKGSLILPNLGRSISDFTVTDMLLASDIEGNIHALNRETGELIWTLVGQKPLVQSDNHDVDRHEDPENDITWIVEPYNDGALYFFNQNFGLQKVSTSIKDLVLQSPFALNGDDKIYTGVRKTSLYRVNAKTGEILSSFGLVDEDHCLIKPEDDDDDDDSSSSNSKSDEDSIILLGKTTYELTIYSQKENSTLWNVTYSSWGPNNLDNDLLVQNQDSVDGVYIAPFHDHSLLLIDYHSKSAKWVSSLNSVAIDVFDIFQDVHSDNFMLLPHPLHPKLQEQTLSEPGQDSANESIEADTFIDTTTEGSWFAMSDTNYPSLVKSAPVLKYCLDERWRRSGVFEDELLLHKSIRGVHKKNFAGQDSSVQLVNSMIPSLVGKIGGKKGSLHEGLSIVNSGSGAGNAEKSWLSLPTSNTLLIDPPHQFQNYSFKKFLLRLFENTITTVLFFFMVVFLSRMGILPPITQMLSKLGFFRRTHHAVELVDQLLKEDRNLEKSINLIKKERFQGEDNDDVGAVAVDLEPKIQNIPENDKATKKVTILEPDQDFENSGTSATATPLKKVRKRGSRGGKKNKKNKELAASTASEGNDESATGSASTAASTPPPSDAVYSPGEVKNNLIISDVVLGYGSHGTVVYKGTFENRPVAIKRMLIDFYDVASQEVKLLQESDDHPNVIRYFCSQENDRFLYVALELCSATLEDVLDKPQQYAELCKKMNYVDVLYQITNGLQHLHSLKIVHRDIKPQNILVVPPKQLLKNGQQPSNVRMLISDFGLCKKLEADQSSFRATTAQAAGTSGWRAPELLLDENNSTVNSIISEEASSSDLVMYDSISNRRLTKAIDIFSMGCVFYYVLSNGQHPFGDRYMREGNIIKGQYNLNLLDVHPDLFESKDLISQMISNDPLKRPDTLDILKHPFFWSVEKKLDFLLKVSDRFEIERRDPPSDLLKSLESILSNVVGKKGWYAKFDQEFLDNLGKYRKYDTFKLMDLLRALRNKYHHFNDLEPSLAKKMSPLPDGFYRYYTVKFPNLVMEIYYIIAKELRNEDVFKNFF